MLTYREFGAECLAEVQEIYAACGWTSYLGDEEKLRRALGRSLFLLGAFEDGALVGFVRCVGEGERSCDRFRNISPVCGSFS